MEEARERQRAEQALQSAIAEEEAQLGRQRQQLLSQAFNEYVAQIQDKVQRQWLRPQGASKGLSCKVRVRQIPGGEVVEVRVVQSSGNTAFDQSVERAVLKASPLPRPRDASLFAQEIEFSFEPEK